MTTTSRSRTIAASPEQVWAVLADFGAISRWAPNASHSARLSAVEQGVGTARRVQAGRNVLVETVTVWEPERRLAYAIEGLPPRVGAVTNEWQLEPATTAAGPATNVTLTSTIATGPRPPQKLVGRVVTRVLAKASTQMLEGLANHLTTGAPR